MTSHHLDGPQSERESLLGTLNSLEQVLDMQLTLVRAIRKELKTFPAAASSKTKTSSKRRSLRGNSQ